jgi:predicted secreted Zn-dependent protease
MGFFHYRYKGRWIKQNGHVVARVTEWLGWSGFDRNKSSRKSWFKLVNETLPHEQGHLDINELYSRRLAEMPLDQLPLGEGADPQEASADLRRKVQTLAERVIEEAKKEQDQYDAETAHGKNVWKQREWSAAIQARLERAGIHFSTQAKASTRPRR